MNVLVVGQGGREHALADKLSYEADRLFVAPGNAGTESIAENVPIEPTNIRGLLKFAIQNNVDFTVVGPDDPLALGIVDEFEREGLAAFGPNKEAAQIEASKAFGKLVMKDAGVPTADSKTFHRSKDALAHIRNQHFPLYVKASGLAQGKGAVECDSIVKADKTIREMMIDHVFGSAGETIVIEEYLDGEELSLHLLVSGKDYVMFPSSKDHKTIGENDTGPMTGGMGTISPVPGIGAFNIKDMGEILVEPSLNELWNRGIKYKGILYPGVKMTSKGPKIIEYNARFGDPETQVYMRRLENVLLPSLMACREGRLRDVNLQWSEKYAACIVLASRGYPGEYEKGLVIEGIEDAEIMPGVKVYHAGTKRDGEDIVTSGGRVLGVTATGDTLRDALDLSYEAAELIRFGGKKPIIRKDIGRKALENNWNLEN